MDRIGFFVMLTFSSVLASTDGGLSDHVYRKIDVVEGNACYRLFNGTHQFGCHGDDENTNGVVIVMLKESDLTDIENCWRKRFANYHGKFWIVTRLSLLTREVMYKLHSSDCISGIAIYDHKEDLDPTNTEAFSDDDSCPNREFDYYQQTEGTCGVKINRDGAQFEEGGRNIHWKLQIAYIRNPEDVDAVKKCYELFNDPAAEKKETYPLCGMSFKLFNTGAGSTDICFRRGQPSAKMIDVNIESSFGQTFCSPLSGHNLFAWPTPVSNLDKLKKHPKYMMIATRMDSFGLIPEMSPGEVTVLTSLITILAVAKAINQSIDKFEEASNRTHKNVMFALFNGEAYDYIGSGATAYRMITHEFPLPPLNFTHLGHIDVTDLEVIVEPQLIGASGHQLFTHVDGHRYSAEQKQIDALVTAMSTGASKFGGNVGKPKANGKVPSSSWHTFAKHDAKVQAIVLGPFDEVYRYLRFNSMQDENVWSEEHRTQTIDGISAAANAIFYSAAEYTGAVVKNETVDRDFISILFDCFINSTDWYSCDFFEKINGGRINKTFSEILYASYTHYGKSTYVSVSNGNPLRFFLHWLMMFAIGSETHASNVRDMNSCTHLSEGQAVYTYVWQPNPYTGVYSCLRSSVQFTQLHSPAFDIPGYDMKNKTFSTWTESVYTIDELRLFLIQDTSIDTYMLVIGAVVALLSFYFVGRCSESTFIIDENDARAEEGEPL